MNKLYTELLEGFGECPICNGTGRKPCPDEETRHYGIKNGWSGYDKETDTVHCTNCGAQYMYSKPRGVVRLRKDNAQPCVHEYEGWNAGRCYTKYLCKHCGDQYGIDSGD